MSFPAGDPAVPPTPAFQPTDFASPSCPPPPPPSVSRPLTPPPLTEEKVEPSGATFPGALNPKFCREINGTYTAFYDPREFNRYCNEFKLDKSILLHPIGPVRLLGLDGSVPQ